MMCATQDVCENPSCHEISTRILQMTDEYESEGNDGGYEPSDQYDDELFLFKLK